MQRCIKIQYHMRATYCRLPQIKEGKKRKNNHVSSILDASRSPAEYIQPGRTEAGVKIVEILTFTRANRVQVKALEKDIFPFRAVCGCVCVCDRVHKCIGAWLGPSVWQYRLIYCPWPSEYICLRSGLTDCEWVWVTALWQSDESPSLSYTLHKYTVNDINVCTLFWTYTVTSQPTVCIHIN